MEQQPAQLTFEDLNINRPLLNALDDLGYLYPTPIQRDAFSTIMSGRDVVGVAQTGTGKTFAFLLPLIRQHKFTKDPAPRTLIVVPTRELVVQMVGEIEKLTKYINLRVGGVYGGTNMNTQKMIVLEGLDVLVATTGRLFDLAYTGVLKLRSVKKLVIDEVDEMLNLGFRPQLKNLLDVLPERRQNLLFSATLSEEVSKLVDDFFDNPIKIEVAPHGTPLEKIEQSAYNVPNFYTKVNLLTYLLKTDEALSKVLVFIDTKKKADRLFELMTPAFGDTIGIIHSNKSQNYRLATVANFHAGKVRALISTDIMARGLDISDVTHVINVDTPDLPTNYIHRIGRTGRADKAGKSITFITEAEVPNQMAIEELMSKPIPMLSFPAEVEVSEELIPEERVQPSNQNYLPAPKMNSRGAFHDKKLKNTKVNRANEKRMARRREKQKARRRKKK
ncbi:MAG: DEAD/DEAH box helicase [Bacteroidota bacterium]